MSTTVRLVWMEWDKQPCARYEEALPHSSGDRASSEPDGIRRTRASPAAVPVAGRSNQPWARREALCRWNFG